MSDSSFNTVTIAVLGSTNPTSLISAGEIPLRVLVRNIGTTSCLLAFEVQALSRFPSTSGTYRLNPSDADVFIMMPKQVIYASSIGTLGLLSTARSDGLPALLL